MNSSKGFTVVELMSLLAFMAVLSIMGCGLYVLAHFVSKFW